MVKINIYSGQFLADGISKCWEYGQKGWVTSCEKKKKNVVRGGVGFSLLIPIPPTKTIAAVENHVLTHKRRLIAVTVMADLW